jgi:spore maturation protein CgeB
MPDYCKSIGVRCEYMPLAFGRPVLDRVKYDGPRDIPVCFIGGLGSRIWDQGTRTMAEIAAAVPEFEWRGYWAGNESDIPPALQRARKATVFGADMYRLLLRSQLVVNRHGEIARGITNNCRVFETHGCGAFLLNDTRGIPDIDGAHYSNPQQAIDMIRSHLEYPHVAQQMAAEYQKAVLRDHCFENRVPQLLSVLESL